MPNSELIPMGSDPGPTRATPLNGCPPTSTAASTTCCPIAGSRFKPRT